jgi:hypothetical protein
LAATANSNTTHLAEIGEKKLSTRFHTNSGCLVSQHEIRHFDIHRKEDHELEMASLQTFLRGTAGARPQQLDRRDDLSFAGIAKRGFSEQYLRPFIPHENPASNCSFTLEKQRRSRQRGLFKHSA